MELSKIEKLMAEAHAAGVPELYFDAFSGGSGTTGDVALVLMRNGRPEGVVNMSWPVAKTLSEVLAAAIIRTEKRLDIEILSADEIRRRFESGGGKYE